MMVKIMLAVAVLHDQLLSNLSHSGSDMHSHIHYHLFTLSSVTPGVSHAIKCIIYPLWA